MQSLSSIFKELVIAPTILLNCGHNAMQYRVYSQDRDFHPGVEEMYVGAIGARVKF